MKALNVFGTAFAGGSNTCHSGKTSSIVIRARQ
jgi:hypothetical protein